MGYWLLPPFWSYVIRQIPLWSLKSMLSLCLACSLTPSIGHVLPSHVQPWLWDLIHPSEAIPSFQGLHLLASSNSSLQGHPQSLIKKYGCVCVCVYIYIYTLLNLHLKIDDNFSGCTMKVIVWLLKQLYIPYIHYWASHELNLSGRHIKPK